MRILLAALGIFFSLSFCYAHDMRSTIYHDGVSCPGDCDAHVVLHGTDNGTFHAHAPSSTSTSFAKCVAGQKCEICFSHASSSCMTVTYRGGGPTAGTFDFTPAFYAEFCGKTGIPAQLQAKCDAIDHQVETSGYKDRINCFKTPADPKCTAVMAAAKAEKDADVVERKRCLEIGESAYNTAQPDPNKRRALACNYTKKSLGGPNSNGVRWKRLMAGACPGESLVGKDGLDCCSNDLRLASSIHPECTPYFRKP